MIAIHDATTGDYIRTIVHNNVKEDINTLIYSKNDMYLYSSSGIYYDQLTQYDVTKDYEEVLLSESDFKTSEVSYYYVDTDISEDNRFLALGREYNFGLEIFDTYSKQKIGVGDVSDVYAVAFSHSGNRIVAGNTLLNTSVLPKRELTGVAAAPANSLVLPNTDQSLSIDALYNDGTKKALTLSDVTVSSSNPKVAKVQYGKLFALAEGKTTITVTYQNFTTSFEVVVANIVEFIPEQGVAKDKMWTITLNKNVSVDTVREKNVYIEDSKGNIVPMLYYVEQSNLKQIKLIPVKDYISGETYTLWIKDLQSTVGQTVKYTKKTFTVK